MVKHDHIDNEIDEDKDENKLNVGTGDDNKSDVRMRMRQSHIELIVRILCIPEGLDRIVTH